MKREVKKGDIMGKSIYLQPHNSKKTNVRYLILILLMLLFLIVAFGILYWTNKNEAPSLTHKWQSDETGVILTFTNEGTVTFENNLPNGSYHIMSPNTMEYTIDNKTFLMFYRVEKDKLYWGINEEALESFSRYY